MIRGGGGLEGVVGGRVADDDSEGGGIRYSLKTNLHLLLRWTPAPFSPPLPARIVQSFIVLEICPLTNGDSDGDEVGLWCP